jgi:hypothetical protein
MSSGNNSLNGQLTRRHRKRNLRKCASFERGKCADCEKPDTGDNECDMKKNNRNEAGEKTQD